MPPKAARTRRFGGGERVGTALRRSRREMRGALLEEGRDALREVGRARASGEARGFGIELLGERARKRLAHEALRVADGERGPVGKRLDDGRDRRVHLRKRARRD